MSTAISQAAKLKPEIRLAQALSQFCADLDERRAREFKTLQTASPPCPDDVIRLTEEINRDGVRTHKAWRPHATSMALFLEKIQTLARIGDFLLGSSQNLTASGVWATVKITLGVCARLFHLSDGPCSNAMAVRLLSALLLSSSAYRSCS
jgi:hypothetical protein